MITPDVGSTRVPAEGPKDAKVMFVGEAPGGDEEEHGRPFVGYSGDLARRYLTDRVGLHAGSSTLRGAEYSREVYLTNLCKYRPKKNEFERLIGTPQLKIGLEELAEDIKEVNPVVIVAAGAWPLYFLTGKTNDRGDIGTGIGNWRGSIVPCTLVEGYKVLATFHPAFVQRSFGWHPVFYHDLHRLKTEMEYRDIRYPKYDLLVDPENDDEIVEEMCQAEFLECDVENFGDRSLACIGFCDRWDRTLVLTFRNPLWVEYARKLLLSKAKKIFQFGAYDINYLWRFYKIEVVNYFFDTYIAAASLMPEFPRGLDFLTSLYTAFHYYKEERKTWRETMNLELLWEYNGKDNIAEFRIAMQQIDELEELFGKPVRPTFTEGWRVLESLVA